MNGSRRGLLAVAGSVVASLAGCLGEFSDGPSTGAPSTDAPETTDRRATTTDRRVTTTGRRATPTVSRNYPATVNATTTVEREEVEYVPENDTVRYVAAYGSGDPEGDDDSPPERVAVTFEFSERSHSCVVSVTTREMDILQG